MRPDQKANESMNQVSFQTGLLDYEKVSKAYSLLHFLTMRIPVMVIKCVHDNPGISQMEVQDKLKLDHQSQLSNFMRNMERCGVLETDPWSPGDEKSYTVNEDRMNQIRTALSNFSK